jgi:phospholipase/carboxylesterase
MCDAPGMDVLKLGPLRVRKIVKTSGTTPKNDGADARGPLTVVLMHGYGAPGDDLVSLADVIAAPAGTTFLFPEAPPLEGPAALMDLMGDARAWWPIDVGRFQRAMVTGKLDDVMNEVPEGLASARESLVAMLDAYEQESKTPGEQIVLGGFSQGSMLADVALRTARPLAGIVLLSGTLLAAHEWVPAMATRKEMHVFQSHGTEDPILPYTVAEKLRHAMQEAGMIVSFTSFDDGHGIPPAVMRDLGQWLTSRR